ncbi:putative PqqD family protein [Paenibacillus agaridevorans]|uniref:Putative PqqD family protein n=1 Tax=Paenibacillus agaridevorans TaxID=171404 RepID=A0A2R5EQA2_9BACL|nr:putative PqqD family protein [Paenibacillus agaridevorans]
MEIEVFALHTASELFMPGEPAFSLSLFLPIVRLESGRCVEGGNAEGALSVLWPDRSLAFYFNETGSRIWGLLRESVTVGEVVNALLIEYDIDRTTCESEVFGFLAKLSGERLIQFGLSF